MPEFDLGWSCPPTLKTGTPWASAQRRAGRGLAEGSEKEVRDNRAITCSRCLSECSPTDDEDLAREGCRMILAEDREITSILEAKNGREGSPVF